MERIINRYILVRVYKDYVHSSKLSTEEIECKTLKEAVSLGDILTTEEKILGSYIFDKINNEKLTLKGEY